MKRNRILILACVLALYPFGEVSASDSGQCKAQPNELAVDLCTYMRLDKSTLEGEPDDAGLGPTLVSKLKGFASSLREGTVGEWVTDNPPRVAAVSETPPYAGNTPLHGLVVLWSFGGGPEPLPDRIREAWPPDGFPSEEAGYAWMERNGERLQ